MVRAAAPPSPAVGWGGLAAEAPADSDRNVPVTARRAGTSRRASQGVLANAIRDLRSQGRMRPVR